MKKMIEQTLLIVKPHAVERGLVGAILEHFEKAGLTIEDTRVVKGDSELWERFYPSDSAWLASVGQKTIDSCQASGINVKDRLNTDDATEIGSLVKSWLVEHMADGRPVAFILSGNDACAKARLICGATLPNKALPGTVRFEYSCDSPEQANEEKRPVYNLVHASDPDEYRNGLSSVKYEIGVIFG
jgi:nucleoside-diphosphate kinase